MTHIIVNQDLCTRCSICVKVCPSGIIDPVDEAHLPQVQETNVSRCLNCGHCEAFCPSQALLLDLRPDEKVPLLAGAGTISPEDIASVSYTHLRAHETDSYLVCRLLLEKK